MRTVFTVGHSTHSQSHFVDLLRHHGITALCDVRSIPFSAWTQQFNKQELEATLPQFGIEYRFMGRELGARSDDPDCYRNGKIRYDRLAKTEDFRRGLRRVLSGIKQGYTMTLMCAEKEPLECHRAILVARHLDMLGIEVKHIHATGHVESHSDAVERLVRTLFPEDDLFLSREQLVEKAYCVQEERIAYAVSEAETKKRAVG